MLLNGTLRTPDLELRLCLKQNPEETYILITLMERNCQKSARCQLYSSISILTSLTNEVQFCVFRGTNLHNTQRVSTDLKEAAPISLNNLFLNC